MGEGAPIRTLCDAVHEAHLWHHAGSTVLTKNGTTYRVGDGRLTPLGTGAGNVSMSHDGRLAAWLVAVDRQDQLWRAPAGGLRGRAGHEVASTASRRTLCGHLAGSTTWAGST